MERRQAHSFVRSRLRRATTLSRGYRDPSRRSTVAVFGRDPRFRLRQWDTGAAAATRARRNGLAVGVRTSLRCGSRRVRGTPLLAPSCRIVSRKRPLRARMQINIL